MTEQGGAECVKCDWRGWPPKYTRGGTRDDGQKPSWCVMECPQCGGSVKLNVPADKTPMELSKERFEAWQKQQIDCRYDFDGAWLARDIWLYVHIETQLRWSSWQTAERDMAERAAKEKKETENV